MSAQTEMLGGRLPLLDPSTLSAAQKETYEHLNNLIRYSSAPPFPQAFWSYRKPSKKTRR